MAKRTAKAKRPYRRRHDLREESQAIAAAQHAKQVSLDNPGDGNENTLIAPAWAASPDPREFELSILYTQLAIAKSAFSRLAEVRGADMVAHQGKSLSDAAQYHASEVQALDERLASAIVTVQS